MSQCTLLAYFLLLFFFVKLFILRVLNYGESKIRGGVKVLWEIRRRFFFFLLVNLSIINFDSGETWEQQNLDGIKRKVYKFICNSCFELVFSTVSDFLRSIIRKTRSSWRNTCEFRTIRKIACKAGFAKLPSALGTLHFVRLDSGLLDEYFNSFWVRRNYVSDE